MIFVNFKTYKRGSKAAALHLAEACVFAQEAVKVKIMPVVQAVDIYKFKLLGFEVFSQHIDPFGWGAHTGAVLAGAVSYAGAKGTLLNHAEKKLSISKLKKAIVLAKKERLKTLVCTDNLEEAEVIAKLKPSFLAYEPPELIGSSISVSKARPEIIKSFTQRFSQIPVLVGAGVSSKEDVEVSVRLGAKGILVSSAVILAKNPREKLIELAGGFRKNE